MRRQDLPGARQSVEESGAARGSRANERNGDRQTPGRGGRPLGDAGFTRAAGRSGTERGRNGFSPRKGSNLVANRGKSSERVLVPGRAARYACNIAPVPFLLSKRPRRRPPRRRSRRAPKSQRARRYFPAQYIAPRFLLFCLLIRPEFQPHPREPGADYARRRYDVSRAARAVNERRLRRLVVSEIELDWIRSEIDQLICKRFREL